MNSYIRHINKPEKQLSPRLASLDLELTERCNNNCIHCCINKPVNDRKSKSREMTTGQIKAILTDAATLGCLQVRFTGGEPFLRPDLEELYLFARRLGLKVLIFTNARLVTPHMVALFNRIPPLEPIEITVYGMHQESYEAVSRSPGSYAQFQKGVGLLLEHEIPFVAKFALLPPNRQDMEEFEAWARMIPWMDANLNYTLSLNLRSRRDDSDKNILISSLRLPPEEVTKILIRDEKYRKEMQEFALKFMEPPGDQLFQCGAGHEVCIDAYGRIQPCLSLRTPDLSVELFDNNNAVSITDALNRFSSLRDLRAKNPDYSSRCARCFLKGLCEQCPAKSWAEHGTLDTPVEYLCSMAHAQARWLGWLGADEPAWTVSNWQERVGKI